MENQKVSFEGQCLYVGIDVHKKQWSVSIFSSELHHKTFSQPPSPGALKSYLDQYFPEAKVTCAYEASKFGFWIQRELSAYGYHCLVVNPADIPTSNKEASGKTDPIDSRKIGKTLRSGLLTSIHVPALLEVTGSCSGIVKSCGAIWSKSRTGLRTNSSLPESMCPKNLRGATGQRRSSNGSRNSKFQRHLPV